MALQTQAPVPARWRFLFAVAVSFFFFAVMLLLSREQESVREPLPEAGQEFLNARIRLQTAALAFSSGKLDPDIAVVTDRPEIYVQDPDPSLLPPNDTPKFWGQLIDKGFKFSQNQALPGEFRALAGVPVIADPRDMTAWDIFLDEKRSPGRFDMILLDYAFPARVTSSWVSLWTTRTFAAMAQARANAGTVVALVLPRNTPQAAACAMTAMMNVFGNVGTIRFGERILAVSSVPMSAATPPEGLKDVLRQRTFPDDDETHSPVFDLDVINGIASLAGYYAGGEVPLDAISVILQRDCSDVPPPGLLESINGYRKRLGWKIGTTEYAKAEIMPRLRKVLPDGIPYGKICAWTLSVALLVYLLLRYFISWKPVHKQTFLAFEDMFLFSGCIEIFCIALLDFPSAPLSALRWIWFISLPLLSIVYLLGFFWPTKVEHKLTRVLYILSGCVFYALAFWLERFAIPGSFFLQILTVAFFLIPAGPICDLVQTRIQEPVQPGPAIPLAFVLGVIASLAVFAVLLFFPAGMIVFASGLCGFRLIFLDN